MKVIMIFLVCLLFASAVLADDGYSACKEEPEPGYFYYFAYGSNLLPSRMHINCPTAKNCSAALLKSWRLDFNNASAGEDRWSGGVSTIVEDRESDVWGNVWMIPLNESDKLDRQEGVEDNLYKRIQVSVILKEGPHVSARTYSMTDVPEKVPPEQLPQERQPSITYFQTVLFGAIECHIPVAYIENLNKFRNNGIIAPKEIRSLLGYPFYE